jgi:hypothetical protein
VALDVVGLSLALWQPEHSQIIESAQSVTHTARERCETRPLRPLRANSANDSSRRFAGARTRPSPFRFKTNVIILIDVIPFETSMSMVPATS